MRRLPCRKRSRKNLERVPMPIDDNRLAFDRIQRFEEAKKPWIMPRIDELPRNPLFVEDESYLDLAQFFVFGDSHVNCDDLLACQFEEKFIAHLLVLAGLSARHFIIADGKILPREGGEPIGFKRLKNDRRHKPGQHFSVFNPHDLFVFPASHDAKVVPESPESLPLEKPDCTELWIEVMRNLCLRASRPEPYQARRASKRQCRLGLKTVMGLDLDRLVENDQRRLDPSPGQKFEQN